MASMNCLVAMIAANLAAIMGFCAGSRSWPHDSTQQQRLVGLLRMSRLQSADKSPWLPKLQAISRKSPLV